MKAFSTLSFDPARLRPRPGAAGSALAALFVALLAPAPSSGQAVPQSAPTTRARPSASALKAMRAQIGALEREEDSRTPTQAKLDSHLWYELKQQRGLPVAEGIPRLKTNVVTDTNGKAEVDMDATVTPALLSRIEATGADVESSFPQYHTLRAKVFVKDLETLAGLPGVRFIRPANHGETQGPGFLASRAPAGPLVPRAQTPAGQKKTRSLRRSERLLELDPLLDQIAGAGLFLAASSPQRISPRSVGSVVDEGDVAERADLARSTFGVDGTGIMVGVISDSDRYGDQAIQTGDVPANYQVLTVNGVRQDGFEYDQNGNETDTGEGTAMMEIVHHLAPGAQIMFATSGPGEAGFANNIIGLFNAGCRVIVDDISYGDESPFQDAIVAQAVNTVTSQGALYFSSASNSGNLDDSRSGCWEGDFLSGGPDPSTGDLALNFYTDQFGDANVYNQISAGGGDGNVNLFWADPLGHASDDYNLYVFDGNFNLVGQSVNVQNGSQDPYEVVDGGAADGNSVVVEKHSGANVFLHVDVARDVLAYATSGQTRGHNSAVAAFDVAATPAAAAQAYSNTGETIPGSPSGPYPGTFTSSDVVELFSSDGPRQMFFNADGSPITPGNFSSTGGTVRLKPDITAADGVSTSLTKAAVGNGPEDFAPFFGTSAAAPHAAAIAALMLSRNPGLTTSQMRTLLTGSCIDIGTHGYDRDSGYGILDAYAAVNAAGVGTGGGGATITHLLWNNTDGKAAFWNVDTGGNVTVPGVFGPFADGSSLWHATALATGPDGVSHILWNNADGHVALWNVTDSGNVTAATGYGPYSDGPNLWSASSLSVGPDNVIHLLWTNPDRKAAFWSVTQSGSVTGVTGYGPYTDGSPSNPWIAFGVSTGPDNVSHLLWANTDGKGAFWNLAANGSIAGVTGYGPYTDGAASKLWYANAVSTGPDNVSHLLWNNVDAKAAFWSVSSANGGIGGVTGYGPFADGSSPWHATALATGPDNASRLVWNNPDGHVALWGVTGSGSVGVVFSYGPFTDGSASNLWSAVGVSAGP